MPPVPPPPSDAPSARIPRDGGDAARRILVIGNPQATASTARYRDVLTRSLASVGELEIAVTENRGHAAALATRAMRNGTDVVVALGGDGTVNEVVNGLLTDDVHDRVPLLGVVPTGSTNVFARALGLPNDAIEATGVLLEALRERRERAISMARADDRWFIFAAGLGIDGAVVAAVERHRRRGRRSTHRLYARVALREFLASDRRHPHLSVRLPDGEVLERVHFVVVANADPWTFAGSIPLRPTPQTSFEDGIGLYARRRMGAVGLLYSMARMAGETPKVGPRGAFLRYDLDDLTVVCDRPTPLQVDGDYLGERTEVRFRAARGAIRVAC